MTKKSEQKRKSVKQIKKEARKLSSCVRPNFAKEFLRWQSERGGRLLNKLKNSGYCKNEPKSKIRKDESVERDRDVSENEDSTSKD